MNPAAQTLARGPGSEDRWEIILARTAQVAALLCPLTFLTSMSAMELASKTLLLAVIGLALLDYRRRDPRVFHAMRSPVDAPLIIYTVATLMGIVLMVDDPEARTSALKDQRWVLQFYAYLYFFHRFLDGSWRRYVPIYAAALSLLGLFAIGQFIYGWDRPRSSDVSLEPWGDYFRVMGLFNLPTTFAGIVGMAAFLLLGLAVAECQSPTGSKRRASAYGLAALLGMAGVVVSLTRVAWLSASMTFLLVAALVRTRLAIYAAISIVLIGLAAYHGNPLFEARFDSMVDPQFVSNKVRLNLWSANWEMIKASPISGLGGEQNVAALPEYYAKLGLPADSFVGHAHNNLLQIWAGQGLVPLLCYLCFSAWFLWRAYCLGRADRRLTFYRGIGLGSFAAQVYFQLSGLTECNFTDLKVNHFLIFIWALTLAADGKPRVRSIAGPPSSGSGR